MDPVFYYILFSIIITSISLGWIKSGNLINPVSFFILWWGSFIFLSSLDLVGIRMPRPHTYNLLLLSISMFSLGGITFLSYNRSGIKPVVYFKKLEKTGYKNNIKLKLFFYFQILLTFILLIFVQKGLGMLKSLDPGTYRYLVYTEFGIFEGHGILLNYIIRPFLFSSIFISVTGVYLGKIEKKYLMLSSLNLIIYGIVILGRSSILMLIMSSVIALFYLSTIRKIRIKKKYIVILLIPIIFLIIMSIFRKSQYVSGKSGSEIITDYFIWYLTGPFTALDYFLNTYQAGTDYTFSICRGFFAGIENMLWPVIKKINPAFSEINISLHEPITSYRDLGGPATHHNSHYTMLYTFYRDAGIYGIIIFPYIFGAFNSFIFNTFRNKATIFNFTVLVLVTYLSLMGSTRWEFRYSWPWFIILISFVLSNNFVFYREKL